MIREWLQRQRDREANGDNWWAWWATRTYRAGKAQHEIGAGLLLTDWTFGVSIARPDRTTTVFLHIGPIQLGWVRYEVSPA